MSDYAPIDLECPNCQANAKELCTEPTDTGRRTVKFFHYARIDLARELAETDRHAPLDSTKRRSFRAGWRAAREEQE